MKSPWMSKNSICELFVRFNTFFHTHGQATKHDGDKSAKLSAMRSDFGCGKDERTLRCSYQLRNQSNDMADSLVRLDLSHAGSFLVLADYLLFLTGECAFPGETQSRLPGIDFVQVPLSAS